MSEHGLVNGLTKFNLVNLFDKPSMNI